VALSSLRPSSLLSMKSGALEGGAGWHVFPANTQAVGGGFFSHA